MSVLNIVCNFGVSAVHPYASGMYTVCVTAGSKGDYETVESWDYDTAQEKVKQLKGKLSVSNVVNSSDWVKVTR